MCKYVNRKHLTQSLLMEEIYFIACWIFWLWGAVFWQNVRRKLNKIKFFSILNLIKVNALRLPFRPNLLMFGPRYQLSPSRQTYLSQPLWVSASAKLLPELPEASLLIPLDKLWTKISWFYVASSTVWITSHCLYLMNSYRNLLSSFIHFRWLVLPTQAFCQNQQYLISQNETNSTIFSNIFEWNTNQECLHCRDIKSAIFTLNNIKSTLFVCNFCEHLHLLKAIT